tara:strand:- start:1689 stop:1940 length:252 start_codon:yes stop_codon:yes gene_type:complete
MEDNKLVKAHGGKRVGAGRKGKSDELKMIERLSPLEVKAYKALEQGLNNGEFKYVQLFYNYYAGKPKETRDVTLTQEQPLFEL